MISSPSKSAAARGNAHNIKIITARPSCIYQVLEAWNRTDPKTKEKLIAGEWAKADLRFVLPVLAEIHAGKLSPQPTGADILKLSGDMPWIADPKYDVTKGALGNLPDTLK